MAAKRKPTTKAKRREGAWAAKTPFPEPDRATGRRPRGRVAQEPSPKLLDAIVEAIETPRALLPQLRSLGITPTYYYDLRDRTPDFNARCLRAETRRAAALVDETLRIADASEDDIIGRDRFERPIVRDEVVKRSQLRVAVRQWHAARLDPSRYGDRSTHVVTGPDGRAVALSFADLARAAAADEPT